MTYAALIFSHSITPRLQYIGDFLARYYELPFRFTSDEENYLKSDISCKINYSYHRITGAEIWIHPHALLFESAVHPVKIECFQHNTYKAFFKTEGDTTFDLLAATFYLISRYEEYLPSKKDAFGRYAHESSLAFKQGFLNQPVVNMWLEDFRNLLSKRNAQFSSRGSQFSFVPTYDIDIAWSYRNKGFKRNVGASLYLFFTGRWFNLQSRLRVLRKKKQDPFDAYQWMEELHLHHKLKPIYFFLVAQQKGKYDRNIDIGNTEFRQLIQEIAATYKVGLHPSWASGDVPSLISKEKSWLEHLIQQPIELSRQHFIRFQLPYTYRKLTKAGIINDYSMGYGSINGFRASIASSFYWYDLKNEEVTQLLIHPFCFMDANSFYEQKQSPEEALREMMHYHQVVKEVDGTLITIWHNSFLGTATQVKGWKEVYQEFVSSIAKEVI